MEPSLVVHALNKYYVHHRQKSEGILFQRSLIGVALSICGVIGLSCEALWPSRSALVYSSVPALGLVPLSAIVGKLIWPAIQNRMARTHNPYRVSSCIEQRYYLRKKILDELPLPVLDKSGAYMKNYEQFCTETAPLRTIMPNSTHPCRLAMKVKHRSEISSITITCTNANRNVVF